MADNTMPNSQNAQNAFSVNSSSIAFFAADSTMLKFSFKNDRIIVTITPRVEDTAGGGRSRWPKELGHSALLTPVQCAALYHLFMEKMADDIKEGRDHDGYLAIGLNRDFTSLCGISWKNDTAEFAIFTNVNADRTCSNVAKFTFAKQMCIDNYDPVSGQYTVKEIQAQFLLFIETLKAFDDAVGGCEAHMSKNFSNYNYQQIMSYLRGLAIKLGVTIQNSYQNPYGGERTGTPGGAFASGVSAESPITVSNGYQESAAANRLAMPEIESASSLSDLLGAAAG